MISVTTPGGTATSSGSFTYYPGADHHLVHPDQRWRGDGGHHYRYNFTGATAVAFGGTTAASFSVTNNTTDLRDGGERCYGDNQP